jgi:hypothetical protein
VRTEWGEIFLDIIEGHVEECGPEQTALLLVQHLVTLTAMRFGSGAHVFDQPISGNSVSVEVSDLFASIAAEEFPEYMPPGVMH